MKTKLFIFLIFCLSLIGCNNVKEKNNVMDSDKLWYSEKLIDTPAQPSEGSFNKLLDTIAYFMEKEKLNHLRVEYDLMINKNGDIEQVLIQESNSQMIDSVVTASVNKWSFKPGIKSGANVNSIFPLKIHLKVGETLTAVDENDFLVKVDEMPTPIGGMYSIQSKIVYSEFAKREGIEGKVLVIAYLDETGTVISAKVIRGIGGGLDEAALDAVKQTKFSPGKKDGKPVKTQVTIPIVFKLQ